MWFPKFIWGSKQFYFPQIKSFFATFALHRLEWDQNIKRLWISVSPLLFSRKTEWDGVILAQIYILIVYKHFLIEGPSMSLPNNYNHQTYQSDLPVLYIRKNSGVPGVPGVPGVIMSFLPVYSLLAWKLTNFEYCSWKPFNPIDLSKMKDETAFSDVFVL